MRNPWLKRNPLLSMWLSAANASVGTARGKLAAAAKRESSKVVAQATQDIAAFWTGALTGAAKPTRAKRRTKR